MTQAIPYNKPFIAGKELYYIAQAVSGGHLSGNGPFTRKCQAWLESALGLHKTLLVHSCTAALEMAALLCDIQPGDEIIMPSFTFVSSASAFVLRGGIPIFIDIRQDTFNLNEAEIEAAITPRTRVVLPVHYAGVACDMDAIMDIAGRHGLYVVEDAAQALFSSYGGKKLGGIGDIGCFSFHETKNVISGEGGALAVNNPKLVERAEILWEKGTDRSKFFRGQVDKYTWVDLGSSYLPNELTAAFLFAQLEQSETIIAKRLELCALYNELLAPLAAKGCITLPIPTIQANANGHIYAILTRSLQERSALIAFLRERGIMAVFHYIPLHSSPAGKAFTRSCGDMRVTNLIADTLLRLPLYFDMEPEDIARVTESMADFYAHHPALESRFS